MILGILAAPVILICIWIIYATRKGLFSSERKRLAAQDQKPQEPEEKPVETTQPISRADLMAALVSEIADEAEEDSNFTAELPHQAEPEVEPEPAAEPEPEPQQIIPAELAALEQAAPERLALAFLEERPQTAAMLLAQMKPETSAAVLEHIPTKLREGIESRMTESQAPDEEILRKAAQMILEHLDELDGVPAEEDDFLETVGAILKQNEAKKPQVPEKPVIRPLAEAIPKERVLKRFEDLKACSDSELRGILSETPTQDVNLALLGAEPELVDRVLNVLPKSAAKELQFQLTHPGKVKLMEVEEARQRMLEHAGV
jgi:flagellar motor switch protein FliG